ncbi:MAG: hypothetical protein EOO41_03610 [Methanobacteriota archaeon]|nr:MAG: hypothetical protein EOO41_03610 [Euryarchaeota archaeon]
MRCGRGATPWLLLRLLLLKCKACGSVGYHPRVVCFAIDCASRTGASR